MLNEVGFTGLCGCNYSVLNHLSMEPECQRQEENKNARPGVWHKRKPGLYVFMQQAGRLGYSLNPAKNQYTSDIGLIGHY